MQGKFGRRQLVGDIQVVQCLKCTLGTVQPLSNMWSCNKCAPGQFQPLPGKALCKNIPNIAMHVTHHAAMSKQYVYERYGPVYCLRHDCSPYPSRGSHLFLHVLQATLQLLQPREVRPFDPDSSVRQVPDRVHEVPVRAVPGPAGQVEL